MFLMGNLLIKISHIKHMKQKNRTRTSIYDLTLFLGLLTAGVGAVESTVGYHLGKEEGISIERKANCRRTKYHGFVGIATGANLIFFSRYMSRRRE